MSERRHPLGRRLYFRIYVALLGSLVLAGILTACAWRWSLEGVEATTAYETLAEIAAVVLPPALAPDDVQAASLRHWAERSGADLALFDSVGRRIAAAGRPLPSPGEDHPHGGWMRGSPPAFALHLPDGRWLVAGHSRHALRGPLRFAALMLFAASAAAVVALPVARRLTIRLERLQSSVEALGAGDMRTRVPVEGGDEIAGLARSFNTAASRIEALLDTQKALLANASHELRSPLARLRMALELLPADAAPAVVQEARADIAELDQLIEEILLASRLDSGTASIEPFEPTDLSALAAEEAARSGVAFAGDVVVVTGSARLLRRLVRNLVENAQRHAGGSEIEVEVRRSAAARASLEVRDRGPGVAAGEREKIFEPFYRPAGTAESSGGSGLGLALVRQIARRHGGEVVCLERDGGGCVFRVDLPLAGARPA